jgi:tetratricopeptide (TPR) repeat protein
MQKNQISEAITIAEEIKNEFYQSKIYRRLAITLAQKGDFAEATAITNTIKDDNDKLMALFGLAKYHEKAGQTEQANLLRDQARQISAIANDICATDNSDQCYAGNEEIEKEIDTIEFTAPKKRQPTVRTITKPKNPNRHGLVAN